MSTLRDEEIQTFSTTGGNARQETDTDQDDQDADDTDTTDVDTDSTDPS